MEGGFITCIIVVIEKPTLFSKAAGDGMLKTRYVLIAFIDVVLWKLSNFERT